MSHDQTSKRVQRESFLQILGFVSVGLGKQGFGNCFVFRGGVVTTFNEDIAARAPVPFQWTGAVAAKELLSLLEKWSSDKLEVITTEDGLFLYCGKTSKARIVCEDASDSEEFDHAFGTDWEPVPSGFLDALAAVEEAAATGSDMEESFTRCVHITPEWVEATDLTQFARCRIKVPVAGSSLILRESVKALNRLGVSEMCETETLLCFRNSLGVEIGVRKQVDEFPDATHLLTDVKQWPEYTLPGGLLGAVEVSEIFAAGEDRKLIHVTLTPGQVRLGSINSQLGESIEEHPMPSYDGPDLEFLCEAVLLKRIAQYGRMRVAPLGDIHRLIVRDKGFVFMVTTMKADPTEPEYVDDELLEEDED